MTTSGRKRSGWRWWLVGLALLVSGCTLGFLWMKYGSAHRRPLVVIGGPSGPWRLEVDGAETECVAIAAVRDEASAAPAAARCQLMVWSGDRVLAVRDGRGRVVREERVTVPVGHASYLWAPELPEGRCLRADTTYYSQRDLDLGPRRRMLGTGLVELEDVTDWFVTAPGILSAQPGAVVAARLALRLVECR